MDGLQACFTLVEQVRQRALVVSGRTPLIEGRDEFGDEILRNAACAGWRGQISNQVANGGREPLIPGLQPLEVGRQQLEGDVLVPHNQCVGRSADFAY